MTLHKGVRKAGIRFLLWQEWKATEREKQSLFPVLNFTRMSVVVVPEDPTEHPLDRARDPARHEAQHESEYPTDDA